MKTELTVSESQHLVDLGVDPKLASKEVALTVYEANYSDPLHPVFRLTDVLEALPKEIDGYQLYMIRTASEWNAGYGAWRGMNDFHAYTQTIKSEQKELIDALNQLLCWTLERKPKPDNQ